MAYGKANTTILALLASRFPYFTHKKLERRREIGVFIITPNLAGIAYTRSHLGNDCAIEALGMWVLRSQGLDQSIHGEYFQRADLPGKRDGFDTVSRLARGSRYRHRIGDGVREGRGLAKMTLLFPRKVPFVNSSVRLERSRTPTERVSDLNQ
jgi:hypothetical protein